MLREVIGEPIKQLAYLIGEPIELTGKRALRKALCGGACVFLWQHLMLTTSHDARMHIVCSFRGGSQRKTAAFSARGEGWGDAHNWLRSAGTHSNTPPSGRVVVAVGREYGV